MEMSTLSLHAEALIFASDRPLSLEELYDYLGNLTDEPITKPQIEWMLQIIIEKYAVDHFPFELVLSGGGYQFLTKKEYQETIIQLNGDKHIKKLSQSAMETLAIIAYKQPITKGEIEYIRGVSSDYSVQKLLEKELIVIIGRNEDAIGKPLLYATSKHFMDYLGINSPSDLPKLKEVTPNDIVLPIDAVNATPNDLLEASISLEQFNKE